MTTSITAGSFSYGKKKRNRRGGYNKDADWNKHFSNNHKNEKRLRAQRIKEAVRRGGDGRKVHIEEFNLSLPVTVVSPNDTRYGNRR